MCSLDAAPPICLDTQLLLQLPLLLLLPLLLTLLLMLPLLPLPHCLFRSHHTSAAELRTR